MGEQGAVTAQADTDRKIEGLRGELMGEIARSRTEVERTLTNMTYGVVCGALAVMLFVVVLVGLQT